MRRRGTIQCQHCKESYGAHAPKAKAELERMVRCGVIEEVTEPTEWCAPMVPVPKRTGDVRICVGLTKLNKAVKTERFILPTIEDILPPLAESRVFSLLDAASGFWQIPLESADGKVLLQTASIRNL